MKKCLLVDDHTFVAQGIESTILKISPEILCFYAESFEKATCLLADLDFDFIFVDIHLGDANGVEVVKIGIDKNPNTFIVAMSGDNNVFLAKAMIKAGASSFITKADTPQGLHQAIVQALNKKPFTPSWLNDKNSLEDELNKLTPQLRKVAKMLAQGMTNKEIADILHVTDNTIKTQVSQILRETNVSRRGEFTAKYKEAIRHVE